MWAKEQGRPGNRELGTLPRGVALPLRKIEAADKQEKLSTCFV